MAQDVDRFGFKYNDDEVYDVTGCMVNLADLTDAPESATPGMVYTLTAINVFVSEVDACCIIIFRGACHGIVGACVCNYCFGFGACVCK